MKLLVDIQLTCLPLIPHTTQITWTELKSDYFNHVVTLEVSETKDKNWLSLSTITSNQAALFNDNANRSFYNQHTLYYRINVADVGYSPAYQVGHPPSRYAAEMIRRHMIRLKAGHEGSLMYLFAKKNRAERCPDCWDVLRHQRSKQDCPTCKGTGFIGGFYDAMPLYVNLSPEQMGVDVPVAGTTLSGQMSGWLAGIPLLNIGDLLIDPETRYVWEVKQIQVNTHKRVITKQSIVVTREKNDRTKLELVDQVPLEPERAVKRYGQILF